jgi:hypothetical protein
MKRMKALAVAGFVSAWVVGCGPKEAPTPAAPTPTPPASTSAPAPAAVTAVKQTVDATVAEVKKVADSTEQAVQKAVDETAVKAQALIDGARAMVSEKKYSDALGAMEKLASLKLNPEQQTLVQGLKQEVTKLGGDIDHGIASLKTVVSQKDYSQGLNLVKQLASYQLTPDQQKVVDGLKAELEKAMGTKAADEAKKALGNVLGGSK